MTDTELRAAAERIRRVKAGESVAQAYRAYPSPHLSYATDYGTLADAYLAGPAWHDKPPVPGLYVRMIGDEHHIVNIPESQKWMLGLRGGRWYGPIPPDSTEAAP